MCLPGQLTALLHHPCLPVQLEEIQDLSGKEVAFETTAAGAVKWRVVDHAEVTSHAKGALAPVTLSDACAVKFHCFVLVLLYCGGWPCPASVSTLLAKHVRGLWAVHPQLKRPAVRLNCCALPDCHGFLPCAGESSNGAQRKPLRVDIPRWSGKWAVGMDSFDNGVRAVLAHWSAPRLTWREQFRCCWEWWGSAGLSLGPLTSPWHTTHVHPLHHSPPCFACPKCDAPQVVGAKSKNLAGLRGKLPTWINLPSSVTVRGASWRSPTAAAGRGVGQESGGQQLHTPAVLCDRASPVTPGGQRDRRQLLAPGAARCLPGEPQPV